MKILVACEESQVVTIEMRKRGQEAFSCDIIPCSGGHPEWHIQDDVLKHLSDGWEMMIAFPPCTYLTNACIGFYNEQRWGKKAVERKKHREEAVRFFKSIFNAPIKKIAIENPTGYMNTNFKKPSQLVHPYMFGDPHFKPICLWLKNLPLLQHNREDDLFYKKTYVEKPKPIYFDKRGRAIYAWHEQSGKISRKEQN